MKDITNNIGFSDLGIAPKLVDILEQLNFTTPTPIQNKAIPIAIQGNDVMGIAQTGTGKTLAFGLPMIQRLAQNNGKTGLVILPTRELAIQVEESLQKIGRKLNLRTACLIGGENINIQYRKLKAKPHIIIATPGRLVDHLQQRTVNIKQTFVLVLDEADRMLDMGFAPQLKEIINAVPADRQTMLFSATMPKDIIKMATDIMRLPIRIEVEPAGTTAKDISQELFFIHKNDKQLFLKQLLTQYKGSVLVFSRTKHGAKKITSDLRKDGIGATEIHSNRSLNQRLESLNGFKIGKYRVMVATDIAARGIDVKGIQLVVNYDLPENPEDYVHRIGRTGRAGEKGHAISFATREQKNDVRSIERLIKITLPISPTPKLDEKLIAKNTFINSSTINDENNKASRKNKFKPKEVNSIPKRWNGRFYETANGTNDEVKNNNFSNYKKTFKKFSKNKRVRPSFLKNDDNSGKFLGGFKKKKPSQKPFKRKR